jgi:hypothetical protein
MSKRVFLGSICVGFLLKAMAATRNSPRLLTSLYSPAQAKNHLPHRKKLSCALQQI